MQFIYIVEEKYNGFTIHDILKEHFGFSKLMLKRIRLNGIVVLNKKIKRMIDTAKTGDKIIIRTDQEFNDIHSFKVNQLKEIPILFEDNHIVVLNKPANLVVHPTFTHPDGTLLDILSSHPLHIATRLDRETSGLMVLAKHSHAHYRIMKFPMKRIYVALTHGIWQEKSGIISAPIKRDPDSIMLRIVDPSGKTAITHYKVLAESSTKNFSYIQYELETGRTHQIRVHSLYMGHPIIADGLYGIADYFSDYESDKFVPAKQKDIVRISLDRQKDFKLLLNHNQFNIDQSLQRQALHCKILGFHHPINNEYMKFETSIPSDFRILTDKIDIN